MKIEKLEPSQHKQGRWLVWLDDASIVRVGEGDVVSLGLYAGKELTAAEVEAQVRANSFKLMSKQSQAAAKAAGRAVDVSADDFDDGAPADEA